MKADKAQTKEDNVVHKQDSLKVSYNFWGNSGNVLFTIQNKSSKRLYLNMKESFFIRNGWVKDYYGRSTYTVSSEISKDTEVGKYFNMYNKDENGNISIGTKSSNKVELSYQEKKIVMIPPHSKKQFMKFNIKDDMYTHCELPLNPDSDKKAFMQFEKDESPLSMRIFPISGTNMIQPITLLKTNFRYPEYQITQKRILLKRSIPMRVITNVIRGK